MGEKNNTNKYTVEELKVAVEELVEEAKADKEPGKCVECGGICRYNMALHDFVQYHLPQITAKLNENQKPKTVYDLDEGDECYLLHEEGFVVKRVWMDSELFKDERKQGNVALTPEPLERKAKVREARESIREYKLENGLMFEPDWEDMGMGGVGAWNMFYDHSNHEFKPLVQTVYQSDSKTGPFKTEGDAQEVIDNCREELEVIFNLE